MQPYTVFPNPSIVDQGLIARTFLEKSIGDFHSACRYVHELPYGYNSDRDDLMILFKEKMGSCTTKHAVIASLAAELEIPIHKHIGIYAMTEARVTGTSEILSRYTLPYLPMLHCFLVFEGQRVDLSEGNRNGKNRTLDDFLHTEKVIANIPGMEEYLLYRNILKEQILLRPEFHNTNMKTILKAREEGLALLRANIQINPGLTDDAEVIGSTIE